MLIHLGRLITEDEAQAANSNVGSASTDDSGLNSHSTKNEAAEAKYPELTPSSQLASSLTEASTPNNCDLEPTAASAKLWDAAEDNTASLEAEDRAVLSALDESRFREPELSTSSMREKLRYLRYFRLVTHNKKNGMPIAQLLTIHCSQILQNKLYLMSIT